MAEPPGLQQPPRDAQAHIDSIMSSGGERAEMQQPQQEQQQEKQEELASRTTTTHASASLVSALPIAQPPPPPPRVDTTVATSEEELAPVRLSASTSREENSPAPQRLMSTVAVNPSTKPGATPPSTPGSGAAKPSFGLGGLDVDRGLNMSSEDFDEAPLLPRGTRIFVRGTSDESGLHRQSWNGSYGGGTRRLASPGAF